MPALIHIFIFYFATIASFLGDKVGLEYGVGLGVDGGYNTRDKNFGGSAVLGPLGSFGAHVGCKTKVCIFGCLTIDFC